MNAIDVYLEKKNTRLYVGRLQKEKRKFVFQYDIPYLRKDNLIALGPDLPLKREKQSSVTLFPSFEDRIPSKSNPAYKEYCASVGISPSETNPFVLLAKLGQKGPSSFVCVPVEEKQLLSSQDLKLFRKNLKLSIRDFADLFEVSVSTVYRIENNKTTGKDSLKKIEIYYKSPEVALNQIKKTGNRINEAKKIFVENFFKSKITKKQQLSVSVSSKLKPEQQRLYEALDKLSGAFKLSSWYLSAHQILNSSMDNKDMLVAHLMEEIIGKLIFELSIGKGKTSKKLQEWKSYFTDIAHGKQKNKLNFKQHFKQIEKNLLTILDSSTQ